MRIRRTRPAPAAGLVAAACARGLQQRRFADPTSSAPAGDDDAAAQTEVEVSRGGSAWRSRPRRPRGGLDSSTRTSSSSTARSPVAQARREGPPVPPPGQRPAGHLPGARGAGRPTTSTPARSRTLTCTSNSVCATPSSDLLTASRSTARSTRSLNIHRANVVGQPDRRSRVGFDPGRPTRASTSGRGARRSRTRASRRSRSRRRGPRCTCSRRSCSPSSAPGQRPVDGSTDWASAEVI